MTVPPEHGNPPLPREERRRTWQSRMRAVIIDAPIIVILLLGVLPGCLEAVFHAFDRDVDQALSEHGRRELQTIKAHLQRPFHGYNDLQVLLPQFGVVTLSHMACGFMNVATAEPGRKEELAPLLGEVVHRALSPQVSPYNGASVETVADLDSYGLYLSHLNLILGCYRQVSGDPRYDELQRRIATHLTAGTLADGDFHIRSYPFSPKWPADQSVTLCSLYLYDKVHHTDLSVEPIRGWLAYMREHAIDPATQLPHSSISKSLSYARIPRGCALSWSSLYMAQFAPAEAAQLYGRYRIAYARSILGCGGFREWPEGREGSEGMDADSGPIVFGIGVSASGLGIGPARIFKDYDQYTAIMRSASVCGMPKVFGARREYRLAPLLGEAILFDGVTATSWFEPAPAVSFVRQMSRPSGAIILSIGVPILAALCFRRLLQFF